MLLKMLIIFVMTTSMRCVFWQCSLSCSIVTINAIRMMMMVMTHDDDHHRHWLWHAFRWWSWSWWWWQRWGCKICGHPPCPPRAPLFCAPLTLIISYPRYLHPLQHHLKMHTGGKQTNALIIPYPLHLHHRHHRYHHHHTYHLLSPPSPSSSFECCNALRAKR